jgi:hypothetical protein
MQPRSKYTYGRETTKTNAEKNTIINQFFDALVIPDFWKLLKWTRCVCPQTGDLLSVGTVYRNKKTSGIGLKDYLICFVIAPERGAICEKIFIDFGKPKYTTVISNKTAEKLNEWIKTHYIDNSEANTETDTEAGDGLEALREKLKQYE